MSKFACCVPTLTSSRCSAPVTHLVTRHFGVRLGAAVAPVADTITEPACAEHARFWADAGRARVQPAPPDATLMILVCNDPDCTSGALSMHPGGLLCPVCEQRRAEDKVVRPGPQYYAQRRPTS